MINKKIFGVVLTSLFALLFSGCVDRFFSVGEKYGYCEEIGCNFAKVGVCANPIEILENKDDLSEIKKRNEAKRKAKEDEKSFF